MDIRWRRRQFCIKCCPKGTENWRDVPSGTEWGKTFWAQSIPPTTLNPTIPIPSQKCVLFLLFFHFLVLLPFPLWCLQAPSMVPRIDGLVGWLVRRDLLGPSHYGCNPFMPRGRPPPSLLFLTFCAEHNSAVRKNSPRPRHGTLALKGQPNNHQIVSQSVSLGCSSSPHFSQKKGRDLRGIVAGPLTGTPLPPFVLSLIDELSSFGR